MSNRNPNQQYRNCRSVSRNHQQKARIIDQSNFMSNYFNLPFVSKKIPSDQGRIASPIVRLKNYDLMRDYHTKNEDFDEIRHKIPQVQLNQHRDEYEDSQILSKQINYRITDSQRREQNTLRSKTTRKQVNTEQSVDQEFQRTDFTNDEFETNKFRSKTLATNDSVRNICKTDTLRTEENEQRILYQIFQKSLLVKKKTQNFQATNILEYAYPFKEFDKQGNRKRRYIEVKKTSYEKLKIVFILVRAAMRISRQFRKTKKLMLFEHQAIQNLIEQHQQYVNKFRLQDVKCQHKKFVNVISSKIFHFFQSKKYIAECLNIWQKEENHLIKDIRRIRFCGFAKMFLKNLELVTRSDNLPTLISHQINLSLFHSKNRNLSQFVLNRCKFYQTKLKKLTINEKLLIGTEYFLFEIVIPSLVDLGNELDTENLALKNQTQYYLVGIISLLQKLFTNHFKSMSIVAHSRLNIRQNNLKVTIDKKTGHMTIYIEDCAKLDVDETKLLQGCFSHEVMQEIFMNKIKWTEEVNNLFQSILYNLEKQIKV